MAWISRCALPALAMVLLAAAPAAAQVPAAPVAAALATPQDAGRMWTFEHAPARHFSDTYGFTADSAWFAGARLSALRIPGCSAAFVSPYGLVATNHHCARNAITSVQREGEDFLDQGFMARSLAEERRIPNYHVDQLVAIQDVSEEIFRAEDRATDEAGRLRGRQEAMGAIRDRLRAAHAQEGTQTQVEITALYHGGRYSAYVYRRFSDVRLVAAPELALGFFGGDPDNFTYPRYALDYTFYRVYGPDGRPLRPSHHFTLSRTGAAEGEPVFVIGNPGRTSRLLTVPQLEFLRDVQLPAMLAFLEPRLEAMREIIATDRQEADRVNLRNRAFSLSNVQKGTAGRLAALRDPGIMARRADAQRQFAEGIAQRPEVATRWSGVMDSLAAVQGEKRRLAAEFAAFHRLGDASADARFVRRLLLLGDLADAERGGAPADTLEALRNRLQAVGDHPRRLEERLLAARLRDLGRALGRAHPLVTAALQGRDPDAAARWLLENSTLADSAALARARAADLLAGDPARGLAERLSAAYREYQSSWSALTSRESRLDEQLGRARFAVYGTTLPPDGTGSPRISDGVVASYPYNGTLAPTHTTFYGMYDRYRSFGSGSDWELPGRWRSPPPALDLGTALNFVSTADTFSGNSGSPAVTRNLELVGLNFDRNIEGLSRDYIYLPERGRNVMVDVRSIRASLSAVYGMEGLVTELDTGTLRER